MKIANIKYDIITEENDYAAESRAQKMIEMANELRAQRDKAKEVYEPATQEIGWKKVQVFLDNIETQIKPLFFALKEIAEAEGSSGRFGINVFMHGHRFSKWELYADKDGEIEVKAKPQNDHYSSSFPDTWVKENGEPRGNYSAEIFYGENGYVANTDFSAVLEAIDEVIENKYNIQLDKMRDKQAYYENSFKKMANSDKDVSLDALIKNAEKRALQSSEKGSAIEKDFVKE